MRKFILAANAILPVLWLITTIISLMPAHRFDAAWLHGIIFALPAVAIGLWDRWLLLGVGLTSISSFMAFSIIVASQISSQGVYSYSVCHRQGFRRT